jgi:chromatin segregation and condensation protein Rec8/ScpA/Scc1 (kleisin family)
VVATFLAILELCRARIVTLSGGERDCTVTATGAEIDTLQL